MKKELIVNLIKEVNSKLKNKTISGMLVEKANSYHTEGLSESEIFQKVLADVKDLNAAVKNAEVAEIVENYKKYELTETATIGKMSSEAGLAKMLAVIKASTAVGDPVVKTTITKLDEA